MKRLAVALVIGCCVAGLGWYGYGIGAHGAGTAGERLFVAHCGSCHLLPDPDHLPYAVWDTVILPRMRDFMGGDSVSAPPGLEPGEWQQLRDYVLARAPTRLPPTELSHAEASAFRAEFPSVFLSPPSTSYIRILPGAKILLGDINKERVYVFDDRLDPAFSLRSGRGLTAMQTYGGATYATVIGSFSPTDAAVGQLIRLGGGGVDTLADGLRRPTDLLVLPGWDRQRPEFIVTEFGRWSGRLRRFYPTAGGGYASEILSNRQGPMALLEESDTTFLVLYGQGDEGLVRFYRTQAGYRGRAVLRIPPTFGSSSARLVDWNGDRRPDLIHTAGDLADFRSDPKPYHGIRIFLGCADGSYVEELFLPLPGAYGAEVADFDGDGRLDIAAVAFFPDYSRPSAPAAVIFYNEGPVWKMRRLPHDGSGRWLRLSAGDFDGDGDIDLAAGSLAMEPYPDRGRLERWVRQGLPFVLWRNLSADSLTRVEKN